MLHNLTTQSHQSSRAAEAVGTVFGFELDRSSARTLLQCDTNESDSDPLPKRPKLPAPLRRHYQHHCATFESLEQIRICVCDKTMPPLVLLDGSYDQLPKVVVCALINPTNQG
jgi:hypothetical protein